MKMVQGNILLCILILKSVKKAKTLENNTKEKLMHIQETMLDKKGQPQNILCYTTIFV